MLGSWTGAPLKSRFCLIIKKPVLKIQNKLKLIIFLKNKSGFVVTKILNYIIYLHEQFVEYASLRRGHDSNVKHTCQTNVFT
jgi:hypothetical protein